MICIAQSQKVKDSNYNMAEIKKLEAIEREAVKMGVAKAIGSAWHKDKTPKEVHSKYKGYGLGSMLKRQKFSKTAILKQSILKLQLHTLK